MKQNSQRRKEDRPDELVDAAFAEFAEKGYAETRLQDVATRAGVSKGLPYLYFKTKEELFKQVLIRIVRPRLSALVAELDAPELTVEEFLRRRFLPFATKFVRSRKARVLRLLIAEGPKHPDLIRFYAEQVLSPTVEKLTRFFRGAQERGEISSSGLEDFPQLLIAPVMMSTLWFQLFEQHLSLDTDAMLTRHVDNLLVLMDPGVRS